MNTATITNNKLRLLRRKSPGTVPSDIRQTSEKLSIYLHHPLVDLFFICGGWLLLLVPMHFALSRGGIDRQTISPFVQTFVLMGLYLISQPHSAATLFKLYGEKETRRAHPVVAFVVPTVLAVVLLASLAVPLLARIEATLYIGLALHHIMAQCYGIAIMYCTRAGMVLTKVERLLLQTVTWAAVGAAIAEQLSSSYGRNNILGIGLFLWNSIPPIFITALHMVTATAIVIFATLQIQRWIWQKTIMPLPAAMTMLTSVTLLTLWNTQSSLVWVFVPPFFHGCQYLAVVMSAFIRSAREKTPGLSRGDVREFSAVRLTELFIVGMVLFVGMPKLLSLTGAAFPLCSALIFFGVNLHHFAADACIWKLRNPRVRRSLT